MWLNKKIKLLPYTEDPVYGMSTTSPQFLGWEMTKFDIPKQWGKSKGEGVVVAVIDTGCDSNHEDLKDCLLKGKNFVQKNMDQYDVCGHGSHVAGTISASNNGLGMVGVAPEAKILPIKSLDDDGSGRESWVIDGIYYAVDNNVDFITMSLGSLNGSKSFVKALEYAESKNCIVFCAAGNSGPNVDIMYPARYHNTISIGAIDQNMRRTPFTCSGESLDFLAPGHDIISCFPGNGYAKMSGTSMSNPFATGCAVLALSYYKKQSKQNKLTNVSDYINIFKNNTTHLTNPTYAGIKKYEGYGIIRPLF